jgi:hypothetical protein
MRLPSSQRGESDAFAALGRVGGALPATRPSPRPAPARAPPSPQLVASAGARCDTGGGGACREERHLELLQLDIFPLRPPLSGSVRRARAPACGSAPDAALLFFFPVPELGVRVRVRAKGRSRADRTRCMPHLVELRTKSGAGHFRAPPRARARAAQQRSAGRGVLRENPAEQWGGAGAAARGVWPDTPRTRCWACVWSISCVCCVCVGAIGGGGGARRRTMTGRKRST